MRDVFIVGLGVTPVGEHWGLGLRELGARAILAALRDAGEERVDCLYAGNMLSGQLSGQENLAALLADAANLLPAEAVKVEAACGSGGAAVRMAALAVAAGAHETALAIGIEKMTDTPVKVTTAALATASDQDYEAGFGLSFVSMAGLLMRRYMHETGCTREAMAPFVLNAHQNAVTCEHAMFRTPITAVEFARSPVVSSPMTVLDVAPICDGAAAVLVCSKSALRSHHRPVRIAASAVATDTISLGGRRDLLRLEGVERSARRAFDTARFKPEDVHLFEPHDAFTIMTALSLEACGFARRGEGVRLAEDGALGLGGRLPICTFGGLKARGHPVGASGAYQIVEAALQLRGEAGANQVRGARRALTQSIGGHGTTTVTHLLEV